jgi:hypothetical protein
MNTNSGVKIDIAIAKLMRYDKESKDCKTGGYKLTFQVV